MHDARVAAVQAAFGDDTAFAIAWRQGRSMSLDEALGEAEIAR